MQPKIIHPSLVGILATLIQFNIYSMRAGYRQKDINKFRSRFGCCWFKNTCEQRGIEGWAGRIRDGELDITLADVDGWVSKSVI